MKERPIIFTGPNVRSVLAGTKTQTRRIALHHRMRPPAWATFAQELQTFNAQHEWVPSQLFRWSEEQAAGEPLKTLRRWPYKGDDALNDHYAIPCPYGRRGDRLWVRETHFAFGKWDRRFNAKKGRDEWHFVDMTLVSGEPYLFAADGVSNTGAFIKRRSDPEPMYWQRPSLFMPRAASRLLLEITDVRVQRLQDISEADAQAEGITNAECLECDGWRNAYSRLWELINGAGSWDANPWVWALTFKRLDAH